MNYDQPMVTTLIVFLSGYLCVTCAVVPGYRFLTSWTVVRAELLAEYDKRLRELEHENNLLKRGIMITQEETGQYKFDLPTATDPEYIRLPYVQWDELWCQYWLPEDYAAYRAGKHWVKRGRKKLWVDEPRSTDRVLDELPYEKVYFGEDVGEMNYGRAS